MPYKQAPYTIEMTAQGGSLGPLSTRWPVSAYWFTYSETKSILKQKLVRKFCRTTNHLFYLKISHKSGLYKIRLLIFI